MEETIVETKIDQLQPSMKVFRAIEDIPVYSLLMAKADGEFEYLVYNRNGFSFTDSQAYILNKWGKLRTHFPALDCFIQQLNGSPFESAELLCECYGIEDTKPVNLPTFLHFIKGKPRQLDKVRLGIFNLLSLNNNPVTNGQIGKLSVLTNHVPMLQEPKTADLSHILPYARALDKQTIYGFWKLYVHDLRYEGVVVYTAVEIYKCKPVQDLDAVIIGINKKTSYGKGNLFAHQQVTSLKLALMNEAGQFIEIGDCASGIDRNLRKALWKLMDFKLNEDDKTVYVKPLAVVTVEYTDLFKGRNTVFTLTPEGYSPRDTQKLIRFRDPRLLRFRTDKSPNPKDIGVNQIPQEYVEEVN